MESLNFYDVKLLGRKKFMENVKKYVEDRVTEQNTIPGHDVSSTIRAGTLLAMLECSVMYIERLNKKIDALESEARK